MDRNLSDTALRETSEELGIPQNEITLLGPLDYFYGVMGPLIYPYVGTVSYTHLDVYKRQILDILRQRMAKRGLSLRALEPGKVEPAAKGTVRQTVTLKQGIDKETAKKIIAAIKASKIKVTTQQMDNQIRVSGPKKDDLQAVIQLIRSDDFGIDVQFINMR